MASGGFLAAPPPCHTGNWNWARYGSRSVSPLYLGNFAGVLGMAVERGRLAPTSTCGDAPGSSGRMFTASHGAFRGTTFFPRNAPSLAYVSPGVAEFSQWSLLDLRSLSPSCVVTPPADNPTSDTSVMMALVVYIGVDA